METNTLPHSGQKQLCYCVCGHDWIEIIVFSVPTAQLIISFGFGSSPFGGICLHISHGIGKTAVMKRSKNLNGSNKIKISLYATIQKYAGSLEEIGLSCKVTPCSFCQGSIFLRISRSALYHICIPAHGKWRRKLLKDMDFLLRNWCGSSIYHICSHSIHENLGCHI